MRSNKTGLSPRFGFLLFIILALFAALLVLRQVVTNHARASHSDWEVKARHLIDQLQSAGSKLRSQENLLGNFHNMSEDQLVQKALETPPELVHKLGELRYEFSKTLLSLWILTGTCRFNDIASDDLAQEVDTIVRRYEEFVSENIDSDQVRLLHESIHDNCAAIDSEYCLFAISVLQEHISFENFVRIPADGLLTRIAQESRTRARDDLLAWYSKDFGCLKWDRTLERFTNGCGTGGLRLPESVLGILRNEPY